MSNADALLLGQSFDKLFSDETDGTVIIGKYSESFEDLGYNPAVSFVVSFVGKKGRLTCTRANLHNAIAALVKSEPKRLCIRCKKKKSVECFSAKSYWCGNCRVDDAKKKKKRK
jgi:hypothetical protein